MRRLIHLSVFYFTSMLDGLCLILFPASSPFFKKAPFGISDEQYGAVFLPMIVLAVIVTLLFKKLYRRWGAEKLFFASLLSHAVFIAGLAAAYAVLGINGSAPWILAAAHPFLGLGFGLLVSVMNLRCVEMFPEKRDAVLSGLHAMLGLGAALAPLAAEFFYQGGDWLKAPAICLLMLGLSWFFAAASGAAREEKICPADFSPAASELPRAPLPLRAWMYLGALILYGTVEAALGNWSGLYLTSEKGFGLGTAAGALSVFWLFMTLGRLGATFYSLRHDPRILYRVSPLFIALSVAGIVWNQDESRVLMLYAAVGASCSYFFPLTISLSTRAFERWREPLSSLTVACLMVGVGAGSSLCGWIKSFEPVSLGGIFTGLIFLALSAGALAWILTQGVPARQAASS